MGLFDAINISGSGIGVARTWMDAISDNIANINDVSPTSQDAFRARYVVAQAVDYGTGAGGARVAGAVFGDRAGRVVHEPGNPLADVNGDVRYPDVDLGAQMTQLIIAQRGYQANLAVAQRARDSYEAALQLGRG